jgi:hypothetical protein
MNIQAVLSVLRKAARVVSVANQAARPVRQCQRNRWAELEVPVYPVVRPQTIPFPRTNRTDRLLNTRTTQYKCSPDIVRPGYPCDQLYFLGFNSNNTRDWSLGLNRLLHIAFHAFHAFHTFHTFHASPPPLRQIAVHLHQSVPPVHRTGLRWFDAAGGAMTRSGIYITSPWASSRGCGLSQFAALVPAEGYTTRTESTPVCGRPRCIRSLLFPLDNPVGKRSVAAGLKQVFQQPPVPTLPSLPTRQRVWCRYRTVGRCPPHVTSADTLQRLDWECASQRGG